MIWDKDSKCLDDIRIEDVFAKVFEVGGILSHAAQGDTDLANLLVKLGVRNDITVDLEYVLNHSGKKLISEFVTKLLKRDGAEVSQDFTLSEQSYKWLENTLSNRFLKKWTMLLDTLEIEFDPINPYEMKIDEHVTDELWSDKQENSSTTRDNEETHSETRDHTDKSQRDGTVNITENETLDDKKDGTSAHNVFGFNSTEEVQDSTESYNDNENSTRQNTSENTNSDTLDRTEKHTVTASDTLGETGSRENKEQYHRSNPTTRELTRVGNIGNTTRQELIAQQREMLQWQFWNVVYDDIDTVLTRGMF